MGTPPSGSKGGARVAKATRRRTCRVEGCTSALSPPQGGGWPLPEPRFKPGITAAALLLLADLRTFDVQALVRQVLRVVARHQRQQAFANLAAQVEGGT